MSGSVVFVFLVEGSVAMSVDEAEQVLGFLAEPNLVSHNLHSQLAHALREGGGEVSLAGEDAPSEMLRVLDAMQQQRELTDGQRALVEALRSYLGAGD